MKVLAISALLICLAVTTFGAELAAEEAADPNGIEAPERNAVAEETIYAEEDKELDTADGIPEEEENRQLEDNEVANDEDTNVAESDGNLPTPHRGKDPPDAVAAEDTSDAADHFAAEDTSDADHFAAEDTSDAADHFAAEDTSDADHFAAEDTSDAADHSAAVEDISDADVAN
eukprot:Seg192.3 transcript_id=Seg192.3/GoldUCD/mRNA.D3Y31 product="hypothetical protein" protein_id=Seg192.3/GoldUCD/D3Y31